MSESQRSTQVRRWTLEAKFRKCGLTAGDRAVWHAIAGFGNARTGDIIDFPPGLDEIAEASGLSRRATIDRINTLVETGWLLKLPGHKGRRTVYRLSAPDDPSPPLVRSAAPIASLRNGELVRDAAPNRSPQVRDAASEGPDECGTPHPSPSSPRTSDQSTTQARLVTLVRKHTDADDDEAREVIEKIEKDYQPKRLAGYVRTMATAGDLPRILDDIRAARRGVTPLAEALPPLCGRCDNRFIEQPDGRLARCPDCHPLAITKEPP